MTTSNNLKELAELEQFLVSVKQLCQGLENLGPSFLRVKFHNAYEECRFALNVLKWRIEDDINLLGCIEEEFPEKTNKVILNDDLNQKLAAMIASIDKIIQDAESQNLQALDVIEWCAGYNREEDKINLKLLYETP